VVRDVVRDGRDVVTFEDLVIAVDRWNVAHKFISYNPLRNL